MKVLHISDFHIAEAASKADYIDAFHGDFSAFMGAGSFKGDRDVLSRLVGEHARDVDAVVASGDFTHRGRPDEAYAAAHALGQWLAAVGRNVPVVVVPGNHDRYHPTSPPWPGNTESFEAAFREQWIGGQRVQVHRAGNRVAFLAADLTLRRSRIPSRAALPTLAFVRWFGRGRAYRPLLSDLEKELSRVRRAGLSPVLVIHFAPGHSVESARLRLEEQRAFLKVIGRLGVGTVFCGHLHTVDHYVVRDIDFVSCGRSLRTTDRDTITAQIVDLGEIGGRTRVVGWKRLEFKPPAVTAVALQP